MNNQNNDIPDGFKMTELGSLPEDWETIPLVQLMKPRLENILPGDVPGMRYVGLEHIDPGESKIRRWGNAKQVRSAKSRFYANDIVYGKLRPYLDKAALAEWEGVCSTDILVFTTYHDVAAPGYLSYLLHTRPFLDHAVATTSGVNHPRTSWSSLSKFRAPVPPLPEQKAIAKVLSTVQKAIETQDKIIAAAKELKKSLMRHLFTYGPVPVSEAEKVPLRETAIGPMPEHWEVVKLGETTEKPEYGYTASATLENVGPKLLRITDIQDGRVMWTSVPYCQCSANDVQKYLLHPGDILFARIGATTGKTFMIIDFPQAIFASYLIRVRCKNLLLPGYLNQFTNTQMYWEQINASKGGRLKQGINIPVLTNLLIPLAPLQEQQEIARTLSLIDARIVSEEGRRSALQSLFKTMLHHLMTGKVRVKDMEATVS